MSRERPRQRLPSGVPGLDEVLCGGLWQGALAILQGSPGAGKTILANQICFAHASSGGRVVYCTLLAESHDQLLMNLRPMDFYDEARVSSAIYYLSAFAAVQDQGPKGLAELMIREREQHGASLVVLDGVFALEDAAGSEAEFRRVINELGTLASITRTTLLLLTNDRRGPEHPEYTMVDTWLELGQEQIDYRTYRYLQVHKSRGSAAVSGRHQAEITDAGFRIFPRLESIPRSDRSLVRRRRLSTGITELDRMLEGGIDSGAMAVVAGPSGVGKTSLGLHFIGASSAVEPGLLFGFYEDEADLMDKAETLGIDLRRLLASGALEILWSPPLEGLIDAMAYKLLEAVRRRRVSRLLVDGMEAFRQSALRPERLGRFFTALAKELGSAGVTTLYTLELPDRVDLADRLAPVSAIAQYIVMLRYAELGSELRRAMMIRKSRRSAFDPRIREFRIGTHGVVIGDPVDG